MKLAIDSQLANKALILKTIYENAPISRINLSQAVSLNKATVSNITADFLEKKLIAEGEDVLSSNGRKSTGLVLNMGAFSSIVIRINRNHILSGVYDMDEKLHHFRRSHYINSLDIKSIISQIEDEINNQIRYCKSAHKEILGISIASLGYLYIIDEKYSLKADGFKTLGDADICNEIRKRFPKYRVIMNHDANAAAMAEMRSFIKKEGYRPSPLLNVVGGIGLGGGIVIDGKIVLGHNGIAGEIGHMGMNCFIPYKGINGDIRFKRGIYEEYASPLAIQRTIIENLYDYPKSILTEESSLEDIYKAYDAGDSLAEWAVNRMARFLAYGLTGLIFILDPEVIVLGDQIPRSKKFTATLSKFLDDFLPKELRSRLIIRFSEFEEDSSLIGAGVMLFEDVLSSGAILDSVASYYKDSEKT